MRIVVQEIRAGEEQLCELDERGTAFLEIRRQLAGARGAGRDLRVFPGQGFVETGTRHQVAAAGPEDLTRDFLAALEPFRSGQTHRVIIWTGMLPRPSRGRRQF
jgi:hypothetical protein